MARHLKAPLVLAADIFPNMPTGKGYGATGNKYKIKDCVKSGNENNAT
jgi:hypothetical protein